ncbi:MAG: NAD(P)H-hydrate dehydratase [Muribaculaceae bacterium]|nr:NAD(P)H-hydrate dehydratase [Muribaculaceae bacterium]MDE6462561.1 NAD(P)H-hydrate dehydratase [Muribaculaceae bacterium]
MKIFTTEQLREIDRATIEADGITALQLIERMAEGVTAEVIGMLHANMRIAIFAGPGNNGADALAVARLLVAQGYRPAVFLFNRGGDRLSAECAECKRKLLEMGADVDFTEVTGLFNLPPLSRHDLVVDGLFGSGLREGLTGGFREMVKYINDSGATIVSIDVPSGLFGDWNPKSVHRNMIHATVTLSAQFPRLSFMMADNAAIVGRWKTIDIGLNPSVIRRTSAPFHLVEHSDVSRILKPRQPFCSKADFGSLMLVAGSYGMMGAAVMAAKGALRAGVGKVTVYSPRCGFDVMQSAVPEAMFQAANSDIFISDIRPQHECTTVALGPGIGSRDETVSALENFLKRQEQPVVLDADALNCIARQQNLMHMVPVLSVLTPHAAEFDRMFGPQPCAEARLVKAIEVSRYHNVLIVLKGRYTTVIRPDGRLYFNSSGNAAMATPGSGDVLTGVIAALMAQGYKPEVAALAGVYIHGLAGDIAAEAEGQYGVTAGDIAANIGRAIKSLL